jgi:hypothetical protein
MHRLAAVALVLALGCKKEEAPRGGVVAPAVAPAVATPTPDPAPAWTSPAERWRGLHDLLTCSRGHRDYIDRDVLGPTVHDPRVSGNLGEYIAGLGHLYCLDALIRAAVDPAPPGSPNRSGSGR